MPEILAKIGRVIKLAWSECLHYQWTGLPAGWQQNGDGIICRKDGEE